MAWLEPDMGCSSHSPYIFSYKIHRWGLDRTMTIRKGERMKIKAWLKGHKKEPIIIEIKGIHTEPIYPINIREYLCQMGYFSWKKYNMIRYEILNELDSSNIPRRIQIGF